MTSIAVWKGSLLCIPAEADQRVDLILGSEGDRGEGSSKVRVIAKGLGLGESARTV